MKEKILIFIFQVLFIWCIFVTYNTSFNTKATRRKRFLQNLSSYFAKNSVESTTNGVKITTSRNLKPVYVFDADYLCKNYRYGNCSNSFNANYDTSSVESVTPVWYLTPPPNVEEEYSKQSENDRFKSIGRDYPQVYYNGYTYHNPSLKNNTGRFYSSGEYENKKNHYYPPSSQYFPDSEPLKVTLSDMICIKSSKSGRFTVGIETSRSIATAPVIENGYNAKDLPQCSVTTLNSTTYQINLREPDMINCGVYYCSSNAETDLMCLSLRIPVINGLKTNEDVLIKVQCSPQQQTMSHTKQLTLKPSPMNLNVGSRSLTLQNNINGGIHNRELNSEIGLYAQTNTGYTQLIRNNDVVALGENLQLRSIIRGGNGWYFSRFGKIIAKKGLSPSYGYAYGENTDSVVIVADDGCVSSLMKPVCPQGQFNDPHNPLVTLLNMRMFFFDNMNDGDELILFVTVFGCVHYEDCFNEKMYCDSQQTYYSRIKRSEPHFGNDTVDETSEFRVKILKTVNNQRIIKCKNKVCLGVQTNVWKEPMFIVTICVTLFLVFVIFVYFLNNRSVYKYINII